jgi:hypothetical protein
MSFLADKETNVKSPVNSNNASNAENNAAAKRKEARATRKAVHLGNWNNKRNMNNVKREIEQAKIMRATTQSLIYQIYQEKPLIMNQLKIRFKDIEAKKKRINIIGDYDKYIKYYTKDIDIFCNKGVCGQGSFGKVFLSRATDGSLAIVKLIPLQDKDVRENAINEAIILQELTPLDISPEFYLFFIDTEKHSAVLIMKYIEAISVNYLFNKIIRENKEYLTIKDKTDAIISQLTDVVNKLHETGIVHYDLKPENTLAQPLPDGSYKIYLIDFGSAQRIQGKFKRVPETLPYSLIRRVQDQSDVDIRKKLENIKDTNGKNWLYVRDHYNNLVTNGKWKVSPLANKYSLNRITQVINNASRRSLSARTRRMSNVPELYSSSTY